MKKALLLFAFVLAASAISAQYNANIKIFPESGWPLTHNGDLPTITLTVDGVEHTATAISQNGSITFSGPFPVPIVNFHITDNEFRHYIMYPYSTSNPLLGIYYVSCLDP